MNNIEKLTHLNNLGCGPELDYFIATEFFNQRPPKGYEQASEYRWEQLIPDSYDDGSFARSFTVNVWPEPYSVNRSVCIEIIYCLYYHYRYFCEILFNGDEKCWDIKVYEGIVQYYNKENIDIIPLTRRYFPKLRVKETTFPLTLCRAAGVIFLENKNE